MNFKMDKIEGRRDFLKKSARTVVLGTFAVLGGFLGMRRSEGENSSSSCVLKLPCRKCAALSCCQEPRALPYQKQERPAQGFDNEKRSAS